MKTILIAAALTIATSPVTAGIVYDNGDPNGTGASTISPSITQADDFIISTTTTIKSAGVYLSSESDFVEWDSGTLQYDIFADDGTDNPSGGAIHTGLLLDAPSKLVLTSFPQAFGQDVYLLHFNIGDFIALGGVQYWFSVSSVGDTTPQTNWVFTNNNGTSQAFKVSGANAPLGHHNAFFLSDELAPVDNVPTPGAIALLGFGLIALRLKRRAV